MCFFQFEEQPTFERSILALRTFSIDLKVASMKYEEASIVKRVLTLLRPFIN
jgi:hypothetical protein